MHQSKDDIRQWMRNYAAACNEARRKCFQVEQDAERYRQQIAMKCEHQEVIHVSHFMTAEHECGKKLMCRMYKLPYRRCLICGLVEMPEHNNEYDVVLLLAEEIGQIEELENKFKILTAKPKMHTQPKVYDDWCSVKDTKIDQLWALL